MIDDFKTVLWKEWRESIQQYGSLNKWLLNMAILVGLIGIFLPLQFGRMVIESVLLLLWLWIPLLSVMSAIVDTIAGERERHTLETLLASRLPDRAILLGKIAVPVFQSWLIMLIGAVLALITVNLTKSEGQFLMYPAPIMLGIMVFPLMGGLFIAGIGVIASSHATTVRQAYQRMMVMFFAICVIPALLLALLPKDMLTSLYSADFAQNSLVGVLALVAVVLLVLDAIVLTLTFKFFKRSRLIAD